MKIKGIFQLLILVQIIGIFNAKGQDNNYLNSKYDFIPGEKIIFLDDFSSESIGDFPVQWNTNGSGEIVTSGQYEGSWFQMTKQGYFIPDVNDDYTENFTIEFDLVPLNNINATYMWGVDFFILSSDRNNPQGGSQPGQAGFKIRPDYDHIAWNNWSEAREWQGDEGSVAFNFEGIKKYHFSFWIQKQRIRLYLNENKVLDIPKGLQANYTYNIFRIQSNSDEVAPIISNFRIAVGQPDMRNKLLTEGKFISYGILFDVNSDKIKPESYASIREIANVMKENLTLRIQIVGHTDSDGDDASNLTLSKNRSESVKQMLIGSFGIDVTRIETDGKGETVPVAPNDTGFNKAKNRRVEFVKI
jgi:OmpA-OmpF porin, OOP family